MYLSSFLSSSISLLPDPSSHYPVLHSGRFKGDNYGYFLQTGLKEAVAVDVPDGRRMLEVLKHKGWKLQALLLTHTHHDHVVFLDELLEQTGCAFYHPEHAELQQTGIPLTDGQDIEVAGHRVVALDTSGHSPLDFSYWFPELDVCFCGDTLFASGCGRMFAGPPERFWNSLKRLRALPDQTRLCCGHDYREDNLRFVRETFPGLPGLYAESIGFDMPLLLGEQKRVNPFLRADDPDIAKAMGLTAEAPEEVFKKLRERRNQL